MKQENMMDQNLKEKVRDLLACGKKIEAIAVIQSQLKIGLKNSKDLVDDFEEFLQLNHGKLN